MSQASTPVLIFGDSYLCKDNIVAAKSKYSDAKWVTVDASNNTLDSIRMEAGTKNWDGSEKILLIENIPNRKSVRDFLIDLGKTAPETTKIIIWDSKNQIKVDPKTKTFNKVWSTFIKNFKKIPGNKVVNNGDSLTENESGDSINFVQQYFAKKGIGIDVSEAKLLVQIVGFDRGMLKSDIDKMALTATSPITSEFIIENAFPSSKEALLYKINNAILSGSYENSIQSIENFLSSGFHPNELAVIILKAARWQLAVCYYWCNGMAWKDIPKRLMQMGKFPSLIWHNPNKDTSTKTKESENYKSQEGILKYMLCRNGFPRRYFKTTKQDKSKVKSEALPHPFVADQIVGYVKNKIFADNSREGISTTIFKKQIMNRAVDVYLFIQNKMSEVRYGEDPVQDLHEMIRMITTTSLNQF